MTRRDLLQSFGLMTAAHGFSEAAPSPKAPTLPGTQPLTWEYDLAEKQRWSQDEAAAVLGSC
jgi:hypothetical protein